MAREQLVQRETLLLRDSAERHSALAVGELASLPTRREETPTGACLHFEVPLESTALSLLGTFAYTYGRRALRGVKSGVTILIITLFIFLY